MEEKLDEFQRFLNAAAVIEGFELAVQLYRPDNSKAFRVISVRNFTLDKAIRSNNYLFKAIETATWEWRYNPHPGLALYLETNELGNGHEMMRRKLKAKEYFQFLDLSTTKPIERWLRNRKWK